MSESAPEKLTRRVVDSERTIDDIEQTREAVRDAARHVLGITGSDDAPPLFAAIRQSGVGWYPLGALGLLIIVDQLQSSGFAVMAPNIANALGGSVSSISGLYALQSLALALAIVPMANYTRRVPRRALVAIVTAFVWSVATLFTGLATSLWILALFLILDGASSGSVRSVHLPLLFDTYPTGTRGRIYSFYSAVLWSSFVVAPGLVALLSALDFTWRGTFVIMGFISILVACVSVRLRDPGFGKWDTDRVRALVDKRFDAGAVVSRPDDSLTFVEATRRLLLVPSIRRVLTANVLLGMLLAPLITFMSFYLSQRWHQGETSRALLNVASSGFTIPALLIGGKYIERIYRRNPPDVNRLTGILLALGITTLAVGVLMPVFAVMAVMTTLGLASFAVALAATGVVLASLVPANLRVHIAGVFALATNGAGALLGQLFLAGLYDREGPTFAIVALIVPGVLAGVVLYRSARTVAADGDRMVDEIVEEEELVQMVSRGYELPMLSCRGIDFSYSDVQVLFDVDFSLEEGEMVCLLGTNGAGKSTLLKVISGLCLPTRGTVRFRGADISYVDPLRRVGLGMLHIAGGQATFPELTVDENLQAFAHTRARERRAVRLDIDRVFATFPSLAARRGQRAMTLSGGEAQMLAVSTALLLSPEVLIIDELSLGLAPKIVSELLDLVREINRRGTAIVLVEQSVNIALALTDHAYFMEKGEIRFDGKAADLAHRTDLLRSVFLAGADKALEVAQ